MSGTGMGIETIELIPDDPNLVEDTEALIEVINERLQTIQNDFNTLMAAGGNNQIAPTMEAGAATPINPWTYTANNVDVYSFLNPLFASLRLNNLTVTQGMMAANSVGGPQIQTDAVTARTITALTITGDKIAANTITADKMNVNQLSAIVANLGTITAGNVTLDSAGFIRGGATVYKTGSGFWLGYDTTLTPNGYKAYFGNSNAFLTWDTNQLNLQGANVQILIGNGANQFSITSAQAVVGATTTSTSNLYASFVGGSIDIASNGRDFARLFAAGNSSSYGGELDLWSGSPSGSPNLGLQLLGSGNIVFNGDLFAQIVRSTTSTLHMLGNLVVETALILPNTTTSILNFTGGTNTFIREVNGIQIWGDVAEPVQIVNTNMCVGAQSMNGTTMLAVVGRGTDNSNHLVLRKNRGSGGANSGILFQNDFWNDNGLAGMGFIQGRDTGSAGGSVTIGTLPNGSGGTGVPADAVLFDNDGTLCPFQPMCKPSSIRDGWTPPLSDNDISGHNISFQYSGGHFYVRIDATSFMIF